MSSLSNLVGLLFYRRQTDQLKIAIWDTLKINQNFLRLISVNENERLENDLDTEMKVYLFEIWDDCKQFRVLSWLNKIRTQIRDGSSLLYDLSPVYVGVNLGSIFGFVYEQPISDYYLLKREGRYFGDRQLLVTILKHQDHYYKVIGFDVTTNDEFNLSLDIHDVLELINQPHGSSLLIENEAVIADFILESLILVKKEVQTVMLCQQRLYLDDYSDLVKVSTGQISKKNVLFLYHI